MVQYSKILRLESNMDVEEYKSSDYEEYIVSQLEYIDENYGTYLKENPHRCCAIDSKVEVGRANRDLLEMQILATINPRDYTLRVVEGDKHFHIQVHIKGE